MHSRAIACSEKLRKAPSLPKTRPGSMVAMALTLALCLLAAPDPLGAHPGGDGALGTPAQKSPEAPVSPAPEAPVSPAPEAPVSPAPEAPVSPAPEAPAQRTPEAPAQKSPEAPAQKSPEAPAQKSPEAPAQKSPEAPPPGTSYSPSPEGGLLAKAANGNGAVWSKPVGKGVLKLWRVGLDMDLAAGVGIRNASGSETLMSSVDPRPNSMTLQAADLSVSASYDPYFDAFFVLVYSLDLEGNSGVTVEEAFIRSKWFLWRTLRVKAGQFLIRFGQFNPLHMHDWTFMTQPVIASRALGDGGASGMGLELDVRLPLPWKSVLTLSAQDARGSGQQSFLSNEATFTGNPIGGRGINDRELDGVDKLAYHLRLANAFELGRRTELVIGASALLGPNVTGERARTTIAGADITLQHRWRGGGFLEIGGEYIHRLYDAAADPDRGFEADGLEDYGLFAYAVVYPRRRYGLGVRYEYATGRGESVGDHGSRASDPFRGDRQRVSPLLVWRFARLARLRLQYNYDRATSFEPRLEAHSLFVGVSWAFGFGDEHFGEEDHHDH